MTFLLKGSGYNFREVVCFLFRIRRRIFMDQEMLRFVVQALVSAEIF